MTDPYTEAARDKYDPRVRYEIRPALDSAGDEYEIIMTSSRGTDSFRVSYEIGGGRCWLRSASGWRRGRAMSEPVTRPASTDGAIKRARINLTAALNASTDGDPTRAHRHLDVAIHLLFERAAEERWRELAAAKVRHQRGEHRAARATIRETAQLLDAKLEVDGDE